MWNSLVIFCGTALTFTEVNTGVLQRVPQPRVSGGEEAMYGQFPWMVAINIRGKQYCGGAIISETEVLTAAHCLLEAPKEVVTIIAGSLTWTGQDTGYASMHKVIEIVTHEDYKNGEGPTDIGIAQVFPPFEIFGERLAISPAILPVPGIQVQGVVATAGFGSTSPGSGSSLVLRTVWLIVLPNESCPNYTAGMFCTFADPGGAATCFGDSGSAIVQERNNFVVLVGIVSGGYVCAGDSRMYPDVHVDVSYYVPWIVQHTTSPFLYFEEADVTFP